MSHKTHRSAHTRKAWIILGLLVLCASVPAAAQDSRDVKSRVSRLENEVRTLSRAIYKGEEPPPGAFSGGGGEESAALAVRLDQLETQIRTLTGRLEEQDHAIAELRSSMERMAGDVEARFNTGMGGHAPAPPVYNTAPSYSPPGGQQVSGGVTTYQDVPQPAPDASGYQWSSKGGNEAYQASGGENVPNDAASMIYENAFSLLKGGQYEGAEQGFQSFLNQYPGHKLTGNAKYWLGETYYVRGQYDKATRTFAEAYQADPQGAKAPDNLLKLGKSLAGMGKKEDACVALAQIEKDYASTAGPVLARSKEEMKNFGC